MAPSTSAFVEDPLTMLGVVSKRNDAAWCASALGFGRHWLRRIQRMTVTACCLSSGFGLGSRSFSGLLNSYGNGDVASERCDGSPLRRTFGRHDGEARRQRSRG